MTNKLENWIFNNLVKKEFIEPSSYESCKTIYTTSLAGNFVATIINGSGKCANFKTNPGEFQYNHLLRQLAKVTGEAEASWFYYTVVDNCAGNMNSIWANDYSFALEHNLEKFETEPAKEGGISYLGLISNSKEWLLLHEYEPGDSFQIQFFSTFKLAKEFSEILHVPI